MKPQRYRVGIDAEKIESWTAQKRRGAGQWYTNYCVEDVAVLNLARAIKKDLRKFRINEPDHGSGKTPYEKLVDSDTRKRLIRRALEVIIAEMQP